MTMKSKVQLSINLFVVCPNCDWTIDLLDGEYNEDYVYSDPIFENRWHDLKDEEVTCSECEKTFKIECVEY